MDFLIVIREFAKKKNKEKKKSSISHLVKQLKVLHFAFCQFRIAVS